MGLTSTRSVCPDKSLSLCFFKHKVTHSYCKVLIELRLEGAAYDKNCD